MEYAGLIQSVIRRSTIPYALHDEAYSEALVILALALRDFDASRDVPLRAYIAMRLEWGLLTWQRYEYGQIAGSLEALPRELPSYDSSASLTLQAVLEAARTVLTAQERMVVLGRAFGVLPHEISRRYKLNADQTSAILATARAKLRDALAM